MTASPNRWLVLVAVILAFIPIVIDMTILHIAVPSLTVALGASGTEILWVIDIYSLMMGGLLIPMGTLSDRVGHRPMMLIGLTIFSIASVIGAFAPVAMALIAARALMAVGAAMVMPSILALIRQSFTDDKERALALGLWSTVASAGAAIGPLVGGFLLEHFWWGSVFLINVPIMLIVLPIIWYVLPREKALPLGNWSIRQAAILIIGILATVYAIKTGFKPDGNRLNALLIFGFGAALIFWFARMQLASKAPMLDLSLFAKPVFSVGVLMAFVATGAMAGFELVLAQELQYVFGRTPLEAGLFMMPFAVASAIAGPIAGRLSAYLGLRVIATGGMVLSSLALFSLSRVHFAEQPVIAGMFLFLFGLTLGCSLLAASVAIMGSAPPDKAGAAGSVEAMGYELGAGLGITFFGVVLGAIYHGAFIAKMGDISTIPATTANSIGEAFIAAHSIGGMQGELIKATARDAFSSAHSTVLTIAATLVAMLAAIVFVALRNLSDTAKEEQTTQQRRPG